MATSINRRRASVKNASMPDSGRGRLISPFGFDTTEISSNSIENISFLKKTLVTLGADLVTTLGADLVTTLGADLVTTLGAGTSILRPAWKSLFLYITIKNINGAYSGADLKTRFRNRISVSFWRPLSTIPVPVLFNHISVPVRFCI